MLTVILFLLSKTILANDFRKKIVILDTGINVTKTIEPFLCQNGLIDLTETNTTDVSGHGTNITHIIAKHINVKAYCVYHIKYYKENEGVKNLYRFIKALKISLQLHPYAVNISGGGYEPSNKEAQLIMNLLEKGSYVVTAAGNDNQNLDIDCNFYPACYNIKHEKFFVVGSNNVFGQKSFSSNYGKIINAKENGENVAAGGFLKSGTSQSTAIKTGKLCK